jgi:hypothetical protein
MKNEIKINKMKNQMKLNEMKNEIKINKMKNQMKLNEMKNEIKIDKTRIGMKIIEHGIQIGCALLGLLPPLCAKLARKSIVYA